MYNFIRTTCVCSWAFIGEMPGGHCIKISIFGAKYASDVKINLYHSRAATQPK